MVRIPIIGLILALLLAACAPSIPTPPPTGTGPQSSSVYGSYRPLQKNDVVEGATIDYQYLVPSDGNPVVDLALGQNLLQLVSINPQMTNGLVAFAQDVTRETHSIYAFDENSPDQPEPKMVKIEANKPLEVAIVKISDGTHYWSVTETQDGNVRAGFKFIRRSDGGLRFVMAYDLVALNNFTTMVGGGVGGGLVYSARLALLNLFLTDPTYQRGENVLDTHPPDTSKYDPRVLKIDPSKEGLAQNVAWAITTRPGPNPGLPSP